ncbi:hypothetical protein NitYY0826_C1988 [Nitratiruptor sp. YY08-26]|uniref:DUF1858 domain-containing protein n=1 Tax=unclassified Nitratiruptor TaxID=2624044 RepID=UPI0019160C84|nr:MULTISPECIES: DUF1858 domain-containing protein [unclassified Nitratiruptor]BCD63098.1 hypothetical protein NitYY0813_C1986 [Nitratiruptor sp. YY08-13]BCD67033.1 hypothetical protein NitYY0826_C1988 [Nitratiruptor sp. YY08-26]
MEITLDTKIYDLLQEYPFLEEELIKINPKFKKLKNPILRRTVARVASIKQAAAVGGMDAVELLNALRKRVGQEPVEVEVTKEQESAPTWIAQEPKTILDANELLDSGKNPLAEMSKLLKTLQEGDVILLKSDFKPEPLIEEMRKKGIAVFSQQVGESEFFTYLKR